jgi:ribosomal protein L7/L12
MAGEKFKVILKGYGEGKGEFYIEEDFAQLFKITREKAKELLTGAPVTIKKDLSAEDAARYEAAIRKIGARCEIENMKFNLSGLSLE